MDTFFRSNPGMSSRIAHHIDFPDYSEQELITIAQSMVTTMNYTLEPDAEKAIAEYIGLRKQQPHFANARSVRNALDRAMLRQANRIFNMATGSKAVVDAGVLSTITAEDIRASRVFSGGLSMAPSLEAAQN
jgi:Holliday junction resolvasome RuvABC ATP-dependent DNA helicase subunit